MPNGTDNGQALERRLRTLSWDEASLFVLQELKRLGKNQDETHMLLNDIHRDMQTHFELDAKTQAHIASSLSAFRVKFSVLSAIGGALLTGAIGLVAKRLFGF